MDGISDAALCFPYLVCAQLYALHRSLILGHTPDQPSRSETVSRVVRGVTIHPVIEPEEPQVFVGVDGGGSKRAFDHSSIGMETCAARISGGWFLLPLDWDAGSW